MELVTGYRGYDHVTAEQLADLQGGILGYQVSVLNIGEKLRCDVVTANKIRIFDGVVVFDGKQAIIEAGDYEDITIENGTLGMLRNDIVIMKYLKDEETGVESTELQVLKGATATTATDPTYTMNDIRGGAFESEIPLYRVRLNGLAIEAVEPLFSVAGTIKELQETANELTDSLNNKYYKTTSVALATAPDITKVGNICHITSSPQVNKDVTYRDVLFTIPDEIKPVGYFYGYIFYKENMYPLQINSAGEVISLYNGTIPKDGWVVLSGSYVTSQ